MHSTDNADAPALDILIDHQVDVIFSHEAIQRGLALLAQMGISVKSDALDLTQAKNSLEAIAHESGQGTLTVIDHERTKFVLVPAAKLFALMEQSRPGRSVGDMLDAYPGVAAVTIPRASNRGGPAQRLKMPPGEPDA